MRLGADKCYTCYLLDHPEIVEIRERKKEHIRNARREYAKKKRLEAKKFKAKKPLR